MPFQRDNPRRDRNIMVTAVLATIGFGIIMASYVSLSLAGKDTSTLIAFLTALGIPSMLASVMAAVRADHAARNSLTAVKRTDEIAETLDGALTDKIAEGTHLALDERGVPDVREEESDT